uniref:Uncharacterized protein n=1 Tax=Cacopsylla melanoneura TaxID=428564 RepID=A0A8D8QXP0_9HEMI
MLRHLFIFGLGWDINLKIQLPPSTATPVVWFKYFLSLKCFWISKLSQISFFVVALRLFPLQISYQWQIFSMMNFCSVIRLRFRASVSGIMVKSVKTEGLILFPKIARANIALSWVSAN